MIAILVIPIVTAIVCYNIWNPRVVGYVSLAGVVALVVAAFPVITASLAGPVSALDEAFSMDALSGYVMSLVLFLSLASAIYSISYLEHEFEAGLTNPRGVRTYYGLLHLFIFTMLLVTMANNLAIMWIGIEATTIVSALLIGLGFHKRPLAIEAAWKYIILCTVGITFALLGTFIAYYASTAIMGTEGALNWTVLQGVAHKLNPATMKLAFVFVLVGYGTKAGLAPVHNWLPDAHSQAPSPISALLSGILLNTAFYGIMRCVKDRAGAHEKEALEHGMVQGVIESGNQRQRRQKGHIERGKNHRKADADQDNADIFHGMVGKQPLQIMLHQRIEDPHDSRHQAEHEHQSAPPPREMADQVERNADDAVNSRLEHYAAHERGHVGGGHGVSLGQPYVQRDHTGLGCKTEKCEEKSSGSQSGRERSPAHGVKGITLKS